MKQIRKKKRIKREKKSSSEERKLFFSCCCCTKHTVLYYVERGLKDLNCSHRGYIGQDSTEQTSLFSAGRQLIRKQKVSF